MAHLRLIATATGAGTARVLVDGVQTATFTSPGFVNVSLGDPSLGSHTIRVEHVSGAETIQVADASVLDERFHVIRATVAATYDDAVVELVLSAQSGDDAEASLAADGYGVGLDLGMRQAESARAFDGEGLGLLYGVGQDESLRAALPSSAPLLGDLHVIRATCGAAYDDATVALTLAAQVAQELEAALASDGYAVAVAVAAGQAEGAVALDRTLGHRVKIKGPRGPHVPPWWNRHRRGGRLWSK